MSELDEALAQLATVTAERDALAAVMNRYYAQNLARAVEQLGRPADLPNRIAVDANGDETNDDAPCGDPHGCTREDGHAGLHAVEVEWHRALSWDELKAYEQQQGGYWLYWKSTGVHGEGKSFVRVARPAGVPVPDPAQGPSPALREQDAIRAERWSS